MTDMDKTIVDAFEIAAETHENISKLIKRCKSLCEQSGYKLLTKNFIHWWTFSDDDDPILPGSASWSTRWFILLFMRKDNERNAVYSMEVNLTVPCVTAAKFIYKHEIDYGNVSKNFDSYSLPVNMDERYFYREINGFTKATLRTDKKSWANCVWFDEFPLSEIKSDNVKEKIFGTFDKLAELED